MEIRKRILKWYQHSYCFNVYQLICKREEKKEQKKKEKIIIKKYILHAARIFRCIIKIYNILSISIKLFMYIYINQNLTMFEIFVSHSL